MPGLSAAFAKSLQDWITAQIATRLMSRSFKHKKRKVSIELGSTCLLWSIDLCLLRYMLRWFLERILTFDHNTLNCAPWISNEILRLIRKKRRLCKAAKASNSGPKWLKYKTFRNTVKYEVKKSYAKYVKTLADDVGQNPKRFWSFVKSKAASPPVSAFTNNTAKTNVNILTLYDVNSEQHLININWCSWPNTMLIS